MSQENVTLLVGKMVEFSRRLNQIEDDLHQEATIATSVDAADTVGVA